MGRGKSVFALSNLDEDLGETKNYMADALSRFGMLMHQHREWERSLSGD